MFATTNTLTTNRSLEIEAYTACELFAQAMDVATPLGYSVCLTRNRTYAVIDWANKPYTSRQDLRGEPDPYIYECDDIEAVLIWLNGAAYGQRTAKV
jgi:hypothetical protein